MVYTIFIGYASEDDDKASYIHNCLSRIVEFQPYKAEIYLDYGTDFKKRIERQLDNSQFMIALLTSNGVQSQWVNQELGYAYSLNKRKGSPHIIPISDSKIELKGFITKDSVDILFLDTFPDWKLVIAEINRIIRVHIPRGLEQGRLHLRVACSNCKDKTGLPLEYNFPIPAYEWVAKALQLNNTILEIQCRKCHVMNNIDLRTFLPIQNP